jgi:DnaJ-domain-containing protein 1
MTASRPHLSNTGPQLNELFEASKQDVKVLRQLLKELKRRTTPSARALCKKVENALNTDGLRQSSEQKTQRETKESSPPPQRPPSEQTVQCRNCQTSLRIPVSLKKVVYSCPTCKSEFEASFRDAILQVVWAEPRQPERGNTAMTEADARVLLGVSASADFPTIKAAWRTACQQYHPDKHQGLPERLQRATELEMKRINEAYRLLERVTALDF